MKLNSLMPDARYDLVHGKPPVFEKDNDGSYLYRYNIEPVMGLSSEKKKEVQTGWQCREVRIWTQPTRAILKKAIIRSVVDESAELAIVNAYNKHVLEIKVDAKAVDAYKEYLQFTEDLDAMLISDFSTANTPD
jgi:hypothetical protein